MDSNQDTPAQDQSKCPMDQVQKTQDETNNQDEQVANHQEQELSDINREKIRLNNHQLQREQNNDQKVKEEEAKQENEQDLNEREQLQIQEIRRQRMQYIMEEQQIEEDNQNNEEIRQDNNNNNNTSQQNQNQINNEQQQQQQDDGDDQDEANLGQNPAQQFTRMISSMNNEPFLNEETLAGIYELLHLNTPEMFDEINRDQENWKHSVEQILKRRLEIYNKKVELISNIYQQNIPNNSMHNIEKIMSIIKSKEKEIYIYKIDKSMHCCHHEQPHSQPNEDENGLQEENKQENADQTVVNNQTQNINSETKECDEIKHHEKGQNECEEGEPNECQEFDKNTLHQQQGSDNEKESTEQNNEDGAKVQEEELTEENLENLRLKLEENEEIRTKQEEQKRRLVEENQRLKKEYEEMVEKNEKLRKDYEKQVQIENYLLRKEATARLQSLSQNEQESNLNSETINSNIENENNLINSQPNQNENNQMVSENGNQFSFKSQNSNQEQLNKQPQEYQQQQRHNHHDHHEHSESQQQDPNNDSEAIQNSENHDNENNNHHHNHGNQNNHHHHHHHHHHSHHHHDNNDSQNQNSTQNNQNEEQQKILGQNFSINDIQSIMQMQFVDLQRLKKLNPVENSITFDMNDNYLIKIKSCEHVKYDKTSLCSRIPHFIFKEHIFPFLSSVELFRIRGVSPEWRELVREVWHKTFKRDMQEQLLATDLCKEIEAQFKLMHIRTPFFQKLNTLIRAMVEVINWEDFERRCLENQLNISEKKVIISLLRIIGYNMFDYENINQFEEEQFQRSHVDIALHLRDFLYRAINQSGMSSQELKYIYNNFLTQADVSITMFRNESDKNFIIFILIAKQYFLYSLLRNYITLSSSYMQFAKNKLDSLSKDWPTSKGFLEGAYRILLLRNVSIKNGQIVNNDSDDGNDTKILHKPKKIKKMKKTQQNKQDNLEQVNQEKAKENLITQLEQNEEIQINKNEMQEGAQEKSNETQIAKEIPTNQILLEQQDQQNQPSEIKTEKQNEIPSQSQNEEEAEEDQESGEDEAEDEEQSQTELTQLMKSIFNFSKSDVQEPDIVIRRKTGIMKIFLDQGTKLDIILSTVISVGMQNIQRQVQRETVDLVQDSQVTLDRLEQKFNENQQQIEEMKQKSQQLEQSLIEKQSELEKVQQQNQQLYQEFQQNAQEIQQLQNTIQQQDEQMNQYGNNENSNNQDDDQQN